METRIEQTILKNLIQSEEFTRKVIPFIKDEYFTDQTERTVFTEVKDYFDKYTKAPTVEALLINLDNNTSLNENVVKGSKTIVDAIGKSNEPTPSEWLENETEQWCKDRAIYIAVMDSIEVIDKKSQRSTGEIPELLKDALSVSFDVSIGHDQIEDKDARFEFYNTEEEKLPFDLEYFNKITKGGLPNKTLNICLAGTGVGKSLFMCHMGASHLMMNKNVLYITMEMSEERIAERIDANIMNVPMQELPEMSKKMFDKKIDKIAEKTKGRLIVKEYPTASAHVGHFRHLLQELDIKKDFKPDIIFIDYLNICSSSRMKRGSNSYDYIKSIAEEIRGLSMEFEIPIWSATQSNRDGYNNSDPDLSNTSESFGLPATADLFLVAISTPELENNRLIQLKQLKNRHGDLNKHNKFVIGIDRAKMKLFDAPSIEEFETEALDDVPVFDRGNITHLEDWKI